MVTLKKSHLGYTIKKLEHIGMVNGVDLTKKSTLDKKKSLFMKEMTTRFVKKVSNESQSKRKRHGDGNPRKRRKRSHPQRKKQKKKKAKKKK